MVLEAQHAAGGPRTPQRNILSFALVCGLASLWLAGCPSPRPSLCQLPDRNPLTIEASDRLNPDASGRSLPTIIRLYQLRDLGALERASFQEVWRAPEATLGESLVSVDEVTIYPEQVLRRPLERDPAANYLVGMGIFRQPVGTTWRSVLTLPIPRSQAQCAGSQGGDEAPPPPIAHIRFFVEDNRIEGELDLEPATSGSACDPSNPLCAAAEQAAPQAPEAPSPSAPEAPSAPELPSAPTAPTAPSGKHAVVGAED